MAISPRRLVSKKGLPRTAGAVAALAVGATLLASPAASAADNPTPKELLATCGVSTSLCVFHPQSFQEYTGPEPPPRTDRLQLRDEREHPHGRR